MSIEISAANVMKLRNQTGLSMMECKKALVEANGDFAAAEDIIRKKFKNKIEARTAVAGAGRITVAIHAPDAAGSFPHASIVEIRAETDFTAMNEHFVAMASRIADIAAEQPSGPVSATAEIQNEIERIRASTGEKCEFTRGVKMNGGPHAIFGAYVHHDGKTGALIHAEGDISLETLRDIGMHIVAKIPAPKGVSANDIPADVVEKERKFRVDQAIESGKPKEIAEKIVEGGMRKFFEEIALLEQGFIKDESKKVKDVVGPKATIVAFTRWAVGEGA